MKWNIRRPLEKEESVYKTIYIKQSLVSKIDAIAKENDTSWNNVVISMIETCLEDEPYSPPRRSIPI